MIAHLRREIRYVAIAAGDPVHEKIECERGRRQPLDRPVVQVRRDPPPLALRAFDRAREQVDAILLRAPKLRERVGELGLRGLGGLSRLPLTLGCRSERRWYAKRRPRRERR